MSASLPAERIAIRMWKKADRRLAMSNGTMTHERQAISLFQREIVVRALIDSFKKLDPRVQVRNPVMFVVEIGSVITTVAWLIPAFGGQPLRGGPGAGPVPFPD